MIETSRQTYSEDQAFRAHEKYGDLAWDLMKGRLLCEQTLEIIPVADDQDRLATVTYLRPELHTITQEAAQSQAA